MPQHSARRLIFLFGAVLVADQVTKFIALSTLAIGVPVPVIGDWLRWTLTYNPGGAFGLRLGTSLYYLLSSFLIFAILIFYVWHHRNIGHIAIPLTIVSGGAAGPGGAVSPRVTHLRRRQAFARGWAAFSRR